MDFFKDIEDIRCSFRKFASILPNDGFLIINKAIDKIDLFTQGLDCNIITFGTDKSADYSYTDIVYDDCGRVSYTLLKKGVHCGVVHLGVTGEHNIINSLSVIALMDILQIDMDTVLHALSAFEGTKRRFEKKGRSAASQFLTTMPIIQQKSPQP